MQQHNNFTLSPFVLLLITTEIFSLAFPHRIDICESVHAFREIMVELKISQGLNASDIEFIVLADTACAHKLLPFNAIWFSTNFNLNFNNERELNKLVLIVAPANDSYLLEMWDKLHLNMNPGHRRWFPTTMFLWPYETGDDDEDMIEILTSGPLSQVVKYTMISDEILFAFPTNNVDERPWSVWETYRLDFPSTLDVIDSEEDGVVGLNLLHQTKRMSRLTRRSNLQQTLIKAVAPTEIIKLEVEWELDNATDVIRFTGGMSVLLLQDLQELMNFSSEIVSGDFFNVKSTHVNLSDYIPTTANLLKYRLVQIMIGHTTPIPARLKQLDILMPSLYNRLFAYVHEPPPSSVRDIFFLPFYTELWIALLVTWVLMLLVMKVIVIIMLKKTRELLNVRGVRNCYDDDPFLLDAYFWTIATITQQGWEPHPRRNPLRIIFLSGSILTIVTYIAYAAAIVSIFSLDEVPIPSLDSLYKSSLPIRVTQESSTVAALVKGLQNEGKLKRSPDPFLSNFVGIPRLFQTPMAFIVYDHLLHFGRQHWNISNNEYCTKIKAFPVTKTPQATSMMMPKCSPLRESFDHKIMLLKERGILQRHQLKFHSDGRFKCHKSFSVEVARRNSILDLNDIFSAIIVVIIGLCSSSLVFLCEFINSRSSL